MRGPGGNRMARTKPSLTPTLRQRLYRMVADEERRADDAEERADDAEAKTATFKRKAAAAARRASTTEADLRVARQQIATAEQKAAAAARRASTIEADLRDARQQLAAAERKATAATRRASTTEAMVAQMRQILNPEAIDLTSPAVSLLDGAAASTARSTHKLLEKRTAAMAGLHECNRRLVAVKKEKADAENQAQAAEDRLLCKICTDAECCVVLAPCSHCVTCEGCADLVVECPICRREIAGRLTMVLS